jgi:hypothetical protein
LPLVFLPAALATALDLVSLGTEVVPHDLQLLDLMSTLCHIDFSLNF